MNEEYQTRQFFNNNMKKLELQKIILKEVRKTLNESDESTAVDKAIKVSDKLEKSPEMDALADEILKNPTLMKQMEKALQDGGINLNEAEAKLDTTAMKNFALNFAKKGKDMDEDIDSDPNKDTSSVGLGMAAFVGGGLLAAKFSAAIAVAIPLAGAIFAGPALLGALAGVGLFLLARKVYLKRKEKSANQTTLAEVKKIIREVVKKTLKENSAPVITEVATTIPVSIPGSFIKTLKEFLSRSAQDSEPGETYYVMTPGKENDLLGVVFSNWISNTMNSIDTYELMDNFDSDLELSDNSGMAAKLAKKGLLTKKVKK